jgi:hypothetical protein
VIRKEIVADVSGKTLRTFCGRPHGAFAFDGQHLLLAPTELDVSSSNVNALLVDVSAAHSRDGDQAFQTMVITDSR